MSNGYSRRPLPSALRWPEFLSAGRRRGVGGGTGPSNRIKVGSASAQKGVRTGQALGGQERS